MMTNHTHSVYRIKVPIRNRPDGEITIRYPKGAIVEITVPGDYQDAWTGEEAEPCQDGSLCAIEWLERRRGISYGLCGPSTSEELAQ